MRFVEVTVNGPKTWSLAAALHPEISDALDAAQDKAANEIVGWVARHAATRVGPRGRQVQVPVERIEAAVIRHYTSRAGDPHRHLHLQINARVYASGGWRGLHSVGFRDSIEAINGIGHAAVATDPEFRRVLAAHGFNLDPETSEIPELAPYVGALSARTAQIRRNVDRYEVEWRDEHPGKEPGPKKREAWDRRAWRDARPDKVAPLDGRELLERWNQELRDLGYRDPDNAVQLKGTRPGRIDRDAAADLIVSVLGAKASAWNKADIRGQAEILLAQTCVVAESVVRIELAEDIAARTVARCSHLLSGDDVPEHVRSMSSPYVLDVEADLIARMSRRAARPARRVRIGTRGLDRVDPTQAAVVGALAGDGELVVVEGAAGAGKTTALRTTQTLLARWGRRLVVVTPTLKAAEVAATETGAEGHTASWLIHQHGWRWDADGHWSREPNPSPDESARFSPGDLLLVDEAGMLDQDTARALLTIADEAGARVAFVGDMQLRSIRRSHVEAWVKNMTARLAPTTIETRFTIVRGVFRAAVADRLIASDPTVGVVLPRKRKAEAAMSIPTSADVAKLLRAAEPERRPKSRPGFTAYVALCAFAGLRRGEALGVQVGDIDFLGRTLRVTRQLQRAKSADIAAAKNLVEAAGGITVVIRPPKYESERTIYLPDEVVAILAEHLRVHTPDGEPSRWLFDEHGKPWHDNLVDYRWRSTRSDAGLTHKLHDLRHYFASGLIAAGCDVVTVQRAMGHASATTTLSTYAHLWPTAEDKTRAAAAAMAVEVLGSNSSREGSM